MDHQIKHFFLLCLLFVIPQNIQTRLISLVHHLVISCDFSCTATQHLEARINLESSEVFWVNLSGILPPFYSPRQLCFTALSGIFSNPGLAIIHGIVQYCFASFPGMASSFSRSSSLPPLLSFSCYLNDFFFASVQPHLKNLRSSSSISFVDYKLK